MNFRSKVSRSELDNCKSSLIQTKKIEGLNGIYVQKCLEVGKIAPQKALLMSII